MYRNKKDVDKHVENLISKLSVKEFKTRAYSVARLYYEVGDYASCQKYVEQYLTQKDNNAAAYKLLGQALQKLGQKDKALEQYKTSLDIDPSQTSTILDICELLADDELVIEPGRAKFWCEKAEATFPRHPVTFRLRERLVTLSDPDPEALVNLLTAELAIRPKDTLLHIRLLKHYLHTNQYKEAFEHSCNVEFSGNNFLNSYTWYEVLCELLNHNSYNINDWLYQLLLLTVKERVCVLSLTETPSGISKSLVEANELLHTYDQAIERIAKAGAPPGFGEFHANLLQHHRGQFAFHAATFLLKKAKRDQLSWRDATKYAAPLMLIAWHTVPLDTKVNWLRHAADKQLNAVSRWYSEGTYRCSQSGHYLLSNNQDKSQSFLDRISQCCSGAHWRDKLYEKIFTTRSHLTKIKSSHLVSNAFSTPVLRLPRKIEVEAYDGDAQRQHGNSLHHFVWTLLNYKNYAHFKCTLFDMLKPSVSSSGPETLNKLDIHAFLFSAALTSRQLRSNEVSYVHGDKPCVIPANITDLLCPLYQLKWWDCAYKFSQNELGTELTDIRATLSRGIEVVRCIDNHGLDPELLCHLGRIFCEKASIATNIDEKNSLEVRSGLYYASAIPLLEKLKNKIIVKVPEKRLFDYTHKEISSKELNTIIEESKLYVAVKHFKDCEYDKVIETLSSLKSPQAYYHLSQTYKRIAFEENNSSVDTIESKSKYFTLLTKAKGFAYKALDKLKETETNKNEALYSDVQELIEDIETHLNKIDPDLSGNMINDVDGKYSSDENVSNVNDHLQIRTNSRVFRNLSSTPKQPMNPNTTNYRSAIDSHILESTRVDHQFLERIENEIKNLQKRDTTINNFMEQTKDWFDENRKLGNQIITTINSNIQNTTDQFKLLKISVDQVKDQIDECRNECKDVGELKKQVAELKKEVCKLKKASSEPTIDENDLYNLDDDYRTNDNTSSFATQLPFTTPQVMPQFNQRLVPPFPVPPNPYHLYGQSLYNLYNQYSQLAQPSVPGAAPIFDPSRTQVNYPGVYSTPDQMYLDMPHLVQQNVPVSSTMPVPTISTIPNVPVATVSTPTLTVPTTKVIPKEAKANSRSLPVNVVITSSDPLPTCTTTPAPILSVTIPPKHIKVTPHNYQITMPPTNETKAISPPVFSFPMSGNKSGTGSPMATWNQSSVFKTHSTPISMTSATNDSTLFSSKSGGETLENSKTVVDGAFLVTSPNTSLNKSRTLSERSNTSVENYDPCPDFKPIVPLPAEVKVTTGEENETVIFASRAKLFRFVSKQWKERGLGEMKLLKHKVTGKVRVLMRREQVHKICANHIISADMEIKPMKNETKAYFWVANDYADEIVVLEKFSIRFKTADIAQQFYETFEQARLESADTATVSKDESDSNTSKTISESRLSPVKDNSEPAIATSKAVIGGFTFSSTPSFKTISDETKSDSKPKEVTVSKSNVFSGLTFKTTTNSPFSNLFNITPQVTDLSSAANNQETPNKLNTSDTVEEFEPNVDFKPVVPLPALVEQKTGEEDENIIFEHRAKLLRFDASTKEWKERGLGCIKLLVQKDNIHKLRLLMRREQIMKICCNHAVTKDMVFQKMPNMDKAVTWCAKDFSEGELVNETFCLRFKTVQVCEDFVKAIETARSKINNDSKAAKEEKNAAKQNTQGGFGDKFKIKPGAWSCDACYTNNLENYDKCACCEQPKPQSDSTANSMKASSNTPAISKWGEAFKPKLGSWECQQCFVRNEANLESCNACDSPKDPSKVKPVSKHISDIPQQFKFGIAQSSNDPPKVIIPTLTSKSGWGDSFKPKEGTWECKECFVRNEANKEQCSACNNPKDPNAVKKDTQSILGSVPGQKFNFGIPATITDHKTRTDTSSIFDGTGAHKFSFGIPSAPSIADFGGTKSPASIFGASNTTAENEKPLNFSKNTADEIKTVTPVKPALLPTPHADASNASLGGKSGTFDFVFKPKTPTKGKSPVKSPKGHDEEESDGNEYASEDDGVHIHFSPVVPMPEKVQVVTGEEDETELYGHRAKLFRFISGEWKERGIGVVKILKHKHTGKLRVVMRREQVLKICLNHALTNEIIYSPKDEKTWLFVGNDFSDGEISLQNFCIRFKTKEIATDFKNAIDKARGDKPDSMAQKEPSGIVNDDNNSDDVVFVSEIQATTEEKEKAKDLMLPENFFTYKNKEPCRGCRGCKDDDDLKTDMAAVASAPPPINKSNTDQSTPIKTSISIFQSPTTSVYGTPTSLDKTVDTSIFRTPLTSIGSNTKSTMPTNLNNVIGKDGTNKENTFSSKPSFFSGFGSDQRTTFESQNKPANIFGAEDISVSTNTKSSLTAPPKLSSLNTSSETQNAQTKSIFASAQAKSIFGEAKSVFGDASSVFGSKTAEPVNNKPAFDFKKGENQNSDFKSIFGATDQKPVNLFTGVSQGSIFGPGVLANQSKPSMFGSSLFGNSGTQNQPFSASSNQSQAFEGKTGFGNTSNSASFWSAALKDQKTPDFATPNVTSDQKIEEIKAEPVPVKKEPLLTIDKNLSFAALSSGTGTSFAVQKKPDFKWEGAGQQLFTAAQRSSNNSDEKSNVKSGAVDETEGGDGGAEEDFDPHYEPIVPLPDKIVVTTGEEDEAKVFGERCKLYRYDDKSREWKERGVGEMKILYHPQKNTYRLLLRREQVHKAVLNMLLFMDLELLPMKNSDRAWTWAGRNYAEISAGEQETLAVRFKSVELATAFHDKIVECVRKLQAAAAKALRDEKNPEKTFEPVSPLRLPKHKESAHADNSISDKLVPQTSVVQSQGTTEIKPNGEMNKLTTADMDMFKQVHFKDPEEEEQEDEEEDYEHDYENADYEAYYNEEEEESAAYYACDGEAVVRQGENETACPHAHIQVLFDQEIYSPKILVTDSVTGEILADMLIHTDTEFQMSGDSCSWSGTDFTSNVPVPKSVSVNFYDSDSALQFYDSCETSKAATYTSTDPES